MPRPRPSRPPPLPAWSRCGSGATPASPNAGPNTLYASPTVVNGVVYIGAEDGYFYAVSEANQTVLWSGFPRAGRAEVVNVMHKARAGHHGTAAVANDPVTGTPTVYVNAPDGNLYALNPQTGAVVWKGLVDTPFTTTNDYYAWGSPLVANGKVYVGISSDSDCPLVPGGLVSSTRPRARRPPSGSTSRARKSVATSGPAQCCCQRRHRRHHGQRLLRQRAAPLRRVDRPRLDPTTLQVLDYWQVPSSQQVKDGDFGG